MPFMDPRPIVFISMFIYVLLAAVMGLFSLSLKDQRGPGYWALGSCCYAIFGLLLPWRGTLPDWLSFVVANTALVTALCLFSRGLTVLHGQKPATWLHLAVCLGSLAGHAYYSLVDFNFMARVVLTTLAIVVVAVEMLRCLWPLGPRPYDPTRLLVFFVLLGSALFYVTRMVLVIIFKHQDLFQAQVLNVVTLMFLPLSVVVLSFSLLALSASRFARQKAQANTRLTEANARLQEALDNVKTLNGLLPICSHCHKIRDDQGYWRRIEAYISARTGADFTHGICPACAENIYGEYLNEPPSRPDETP